MYFDRSAPVALKWLSLERAWIKPMSHRCLVASRGSTGLGRYAIVLSTTIHVECIQNHVWGPPGARVMTIFIKTYICVKVDLSNNHG